MGPGSIDPDAEDAPPGLSVVIPVFDEGDTVEACVRRVLSAPISLTLEVIAVDDGSRDGSLDVLERLATEDPRVRVCRHERNQGKGAALRTGFLEARGRFVLIQDADLEYDPRDYPTLLAPLLDGRADVVYGSRFLGGAGRAHLFLNYLANRFLTTLSNLLTNLNLTDMETGYKVFRREVVAHLDLRSRGFTVEPEITAKVAGMRARVFEVAISYNGRDYGEGKKIGWTDGLAAIWAILRFNLFRGRMPRLMRQPVGSGSRD
jgi:glycosyltransferase involved in cell wall biosynthesis